MSYTHVGYRICHEGYNPTGNGQFKNDIAVIRSVLSETNLSFFLHLNGENCNNDPKLLKYDNLKLDFYVCLKSWILMMYEMKFRVKYCLH